jgi:hypothetical protein
MYQRNTGTESLALPTSLSSAFSQLHLENSPSDVAQSPTPPTDASNIQAASNSTSFTNPDPVAQETVDSSSNFEYNTFTLFPELPLELRRMIWRQALPGPRYVELRTAAKFVDSSGRHVYENDPQYLIFTAVEKAPVLFSTCHEARTEVVKVYRPFKGIKKNSGSVWLDPRTDVLCFRYDYFMAEVHDALLLMDSALRESLESITVDAYVIQDDWYEIHDDLVSLLPSLKEIHITDLKNPGYEEYDRKKAVIALNVLGVLDEPEHYDMARKMIMDTKIKHPEWKEPVIKPGKCVVGSEKWANAGIGLY